MTKIYLNWRMKLVDLKWLSFCLFASNSINRSINGESNWEISWILYLFNIDDLQLTLGFILWSGKAMECTWTVWRLSLLSQRILDSLTFLISSSCSREKEDGKLEFSYQNLSPNLMLWNDLPITQAKVGPTREPGRGISVIPADQRSGKKYF